MKMIAFIAALLCSSVICGAAEINGRETSLPGDLVVLKATTETDRFCWVYDKAAYGFDALRCDADKSIAFSAAKPGRYVFWVIAEESDALATVRHIVTVSALPSDHTKPPGGGPADPVSDIEKTADAMAAKFAIVSGKLRDPDTAAAIATQWMAVSGKVRGSPTLEDAGVVISDATRAALAARKGVSRYVDWLNGFRVPLNKEIKDAIDAGHIKTPADLDVVIQAIAGGM